MVVQNFGKSDVWCKKKILASTRCIPMLYSQKNLILADLFKESKKESKARHFHWHMNPFYQSLVDLAVYMVKYLW